MYSSFQLACKYLQYYLSAANGKGHGVHSPFVYRFIDQVLNDKRQYPCYTEVEAIRTGLLEDRTSITVTDFGAGSAMINDHTRVVKRVAQTSLKSAKYAQLMFRIVQYFKPENIIELGTSFGVTTSYMANGYPQSKIYSLEGAPSIAAIARQVFERQGLRQIELIEGRFADTLPGLLQKLQHVDLAYVDGHHQYAPTIEYFHWLKEKAGPQTVFIFDDIHWSSGMEKAWKVICDDPAVTRSIDLFFIGLVFFDPSFKEKERFRIRF